MTTTVATMIVLALCAVFLLSGTLASVLQILDLWKSRRDTLPVMTLCDECLASLRRGNVFRYHGKLLCGRCLSEIAHKEGKDE